MSNIDARLPQAVAGRVFLQQQIFQTLGRARAAAEPAAPGDTGVDSVAATIAGALRDSLGDAVGAAPKSASRYAVHDLAQSLRAALAASGPDARQRVATLLDRLDAGFTEARRRLEAAGVDARSIDAALASFRERLSDLLDAYARGVDRPAQSSLAATGVPVADDRSAPPADGAIAPLAATATRATYVRKESMRLEVLTQDGDVVSLRIRNKDVMQASGAAAAWADAAVQQGRVDVLSTSKVRIEVRGDLDEAELAAIQDLAAQAGAIADRFFAGDAAAAFEAGAALELDAGQIAAAGLKLAVRERFTLQQATSVQPGAQVAAAPTPASTAGAAATAAPVRDTAESAPVSAPMPPDGGGGPVAGEAVAAGLGAQIANLLAWAQASTDAGRLEIRMQFKLRLVATLVDLGTPVDATAGDALRRRTLHQLTAPAATAAT